LSATPWLRAAALAFRSLPFSRNVNKVIHALIQTLGLAASTGGLATVIIFKDKTGNEHMYSLHAWLGVSSYALFALQVCPSLFTFT
jgi:hypothetical protein